MQYIRNAELSKYPPSHSQHGIFVSLYFLFSPVSSLLATTELNCSLHVFIIFLSSKKFKFVSFGSDLHLDFEFLVSHWEKLDSMYLHSLSH